MDTKRASNNDEKTKEMSSVAQKNMDELTDELAHIDLVNWVS
ncbi:hypothetical protein [Bacillus sp. 2205SS5-2]